MMHSNEKSRVVVAMSGGVDAPSRRLLVGRATGDWRCCACGQTGEGGSNRCCTPGQMADARRIADKLGIPFYVIDTQDVFRQRSCSSSSTATPRATRRTPAWVQRHIRFSGCSIALALDADYLATGHYARIRRDVDGTAHLPGWIGEGSSYVLSVLTQEKLRHALTGW